MLSRSKWFRCSVLAVASVAMLVLPSAARAHETGEHAPVMANCPPGGATQNAVCFALRGVEYSLRHGGTKEVAEELAGNTAGNVGELEDGLTGAVETYQQEVAQEAMAFGTTMVAVGDVFKTSVELAALNLEQALDAGLVNALVGSDSYAAGGVSAAQAFLESDGVAPCPVNPPAPVFPQTIGALRALSCAIWAALPSDTSALEQHLDQADEALAGISLPFANALTALGSALEEASFDLAEGTTLATDTLADATTAATDAAADAAAAATEAAGASQVFDTFYAAQCVRKADYGPFTRPTPCPFIP